MFNLFAALLTFVLAFHPVLAGVYTTSPVGSSVATGGQVITVSWRE